jgi:hypothetical protein
MNPKILRKLTISLFFVTASLSYSQDYSIEPIGDVTNILPLWEQAKIMEKQLRVRKKTVLPEVMRREGVDMWLVSRDQYLLYLSLVTADDEGLVSHRPDVLILYDRGKAQGIEALEEDYQQLESIVRSRDPKKIAVSVDAKERMTTLIGQPFTNRLVSSETLRDAFLEIRSDEEMSLFEYVARVAHEVIAEAFSNRAILPDVTTTDELNWWIRQRYRDLGLLTSDHPTITVQRSKLDRPKYGDSDEHFRIDIPPRNGYNTVIRRGDLIFCDTGINYLGLGTDTQQVAYVLKKGESDAPPGLKQALRNTNRLQEIFAAEFAEGRMSNDIVLAALEKARAEGLRPEIYSHPLPHFLMRYSLNGAFYKRTRYFVGPELGGEGDKDPDAGGGSPVYRNTVYAMELDTETSVPEWGGQDVRIVLEQSVAFTGGKIVFLGGRQTEFYLIK